MPPLFVNTVIAVVVVISPCTQPLLHVQGLNWGVAALHEDEDAVARKEKIVKSFAVDPIAFLSGKVQHSEFFFCVMTEIRFCFLFHD